MSAAGRKRPPRRLPDGTVLPRRIEPPPAPETPEAQYVRGALLITKLTTSDLLFHAASLVATNEPLLAAELRVRGSRLANARRDNPRHAVIAFVEDAP